MRRLTTAILNHRTARLVLSAALATATVPGVDGPLAAQDPSVTRTVQVPAADRPIEARVDHLFTLGELETADWQAFGRIRAVAFGPSGDLFILDQQARQVHRVSPTGDYLGPVGRAGEGPGEYQLPTGLTVGPDGTIVVRDTGRRSWALFGPDGVYLRNMRPDDSEGALSDVRLAPDGSVYGMPNDLLMVEDGRVTRRYLTAGGGTVDDIDRLPLLRLDPSWEEPEVLDRVWLPPREAAEGGLRDMAFLAEPHWAVLPDGSVAVSDSLTWEIRIHGAHAGRPDRRIVRALEPIEITDRMKEAEIERRAALPNNGATGGVVAFGSTPEERERAARRALERRLRAGIGFPVERQIIRDMMVDPAGRLWVARATTNIDPDAPGPVDVIGPDGRYIGTIPEFDLPDSFGPDGLAVWRTTGELDIPVLHVRRVTLGG